MNTFEDFFFENGKKRLRDYINNHFGSEIQANEA